MSTNRQTPDPGQSSTSATIVEPQREEQGLGTTPEERHGMHSVAEDETLLPLTDPERIAQLEAEVRDLKASYRSVEEQLATITKVLACNGVALTMLATERSDDGVGQMGGQPS